MHTFSFLSIYLSILCTVGQVRLYDDAFTIDRWPVATIVATQTSPPKVRVIFPKANYPIEVNRSNHKRKRRIRINNTNKNRPTRNRIE